MKKLVPDPPPVLCIGPGLSHDQALHKALEHLKQAIEYASSLTDLKNEQNALTLSDALLDMRIAKALLGVALAASPVTIPI
ncbi:hypothetical protein ACX3YG_18775 [Pseudomonas wadenswilerensis]